MLNRLQADLKTAMLARDAVRTQVIRMALAAYKNEAVAKGLSPQGILAEADALAACRQVREAGISALFIDTSPRAQPDGDRFASDAL